jgi:heat shock protein HslJ
MAAGRRAFHLPGPVGGVLLLLLASACTTAGAPDTAAEPGSLATGAGPEDRNDAPAPQATAPAAADRAPTDRGAATLEGGEWVVAEMDGRPLLEGSRITLVFADGQVSGLASCNQYVADWSRSSPSGIRVGSPRSTLRACAPAVMDQERRFLDLLEGLESLDMARSGELVLRTAEGNAVRALR